MRYIGDPRSWSSFKILKNIFFINIVICYKKRNLYKFKLNLNLYLNLKRIIFGKRIKNELIKF
jgi:hypothetical protein